MELITQIINKKLELSDELLLNRRYKRAIWNFYSAFNISLAILKIKDSQEHARNKLWKKFILLKRIDEKNFKRIKEFMKRDTEVIIQALKIMEVQAEQRGIEAGDGFYKPNAGHIGVMSYEIVD